MAAEGIEDKVTSAWDAVKSNPIPFIVAGFILVAWALGSDAQQSGKKSVAASKWPIIGPYFFKNTPLAAPTATS
jgi:hypothetical protein